MSRKLGGGCLSSTFPSFNPGDVTAEFVMWRESFRGWIRKHKCHKLSGMLFIRTTLRQFLTIYSLKQLPCLIIVCRVWSASLDSSASIEYLSVHLMMRSLFIHSPIHPPIHPSVYLKFHLQAQQQQLIRWLTWRINKENGRWLKIDVLKMTAENSSLSVCVCVCVRMETLNEINMTWNLHTSSSKPIAGQVGCFQFSSFPTFTLS